VSKFKRMVNMTVRPNVQQNTMVKYILHSP